MDFGRLVFGISQCEFHDFHGLLASPLGDQYPGSGSKRWGTLSSIFGHLIQNMIRFWDCFWIRANDAFSGASQTIGSTMNTAGSLMQFRSKEEGSFGSTKGLLIPLDFRQKINGLGLHIWVLNPSGQV